MRVASLYNPQLSLFRSYMVSEKFASAWRAPVAQTSTGSFVIAERTEACSDPASCWGHSQSRISGSEEPIWEYLQRVWILGDQSPGPMSCLACCMFLHLIYPPFAHTNNSSGQEKLLSTTLHPAQDNGPFLLNNGKVYNSLPYLNTMSEGKKR